MSEKLTMVERVRLAHCFRKAIRRRRWVIDCHTVARIAYLTLKRLGFDPEVYTGYVVTFAQRLRVEHTWVEFDGYVVETNPSQIFSLPFPALIMRKDFWEQTVDVIWSRRIEESEMWVLVTQRGREMMEEVAEEIVRCYKKYGVGHG